MSREELIKQNIIHEYDHDLAISNSNGLYGFLQSGYYAKIIEKIDHGKILDCGCGFGLLSKMCRDRGLSIASIDVDEESAKVASELYNIDVEIVDLFDINPLERTFDVALLFDVISHLDIGKTAGKLRELGVKQVIIGDSNLKNMMLMLYRKMSGHEEHHDWSTKQVVEAMGAAGYSLETMVHYNTIGLPASGGFLRKPVGFFERHPKLTQSMDTTLSTVFRAIKLDTFTAFRYVAFFRAT